MSAYSLRDWGSVSDLPGDSPLSNSSDDESNKGGGDLLGCLGQEKTGQEAD